MNAPPNNPDRVLIVDDEPHVLDGLVRSIGRAFAVTTANSGAEGLERLRANGPFGVVVTDMRMPGMDGVEFLVRARTVSPRSVFVMLTGNQDQQTAAEALNRGRIHRFLTKPCAQATLTEAIASAAEQHRFAARERQLLEKTLAGSIHAMLQVLQLTRPRVFQRSTRIARLAKWLAVRVNDPEPWQVEIAAALAMIGCVALPDDVIDASIERNEIAERDRAVVARHPKIGSRLISPIPRLERVAAIIAGQRVGLDDESIIPASDEAPTPETDDEIASGVAILRAATELEARLSRKVVWLVAADQVSRLTGMSPAIVQALRGAPPDWIESDQTGSVRVVNVREVRLGMILQEDVRGVRGDLLIASGHCINEILAERLRSFAKTGKIDGMVRVIDPAGEE